MTDIVEIRRSDDPRDVIHRVCQSLAQGELVGLPTETTYTVAASALSEVGVQRLKALATELAVNHQPPQFELLLKAADEALDYLVEQSRYGRKLIRRCWPGPVTLRFPKSHCGWFFEQLPETSRHLLTAPENTVSFRVPAHTLPADILNLLPGPLIALSEAQPGRPPLRHARDADQRFGNNLALIVDDGPSRYGEPGTVVQIGNNDWNIAFPGVVSDRTMGRLASEVILFACTGNTCRSPMAEVLFRKLLAEKLSCPEEELVDHGYVILSAGLAAAIGAPANPEAIALLADEGLDLRNHESQPLTERLLQQVDMIYTMTRGHRDAILAERPDLASRVRTLSPAGKDIADPIGGGRDVYRSCKQVIETHLQQIIQDLLSLRSHPS
ncbi:Protein-tyrosine phosphatase, low molecular weight [Planctopirus limnophila DSM 3776]|uniref:L-threonylcarbamoyladenylate synthase n=1 Tax=Planctopirus limnophila (strain ATCC 43296 / DSM 3776 / IFAM 1008 / Mu 290) TaxID=521674 RepID=D5SQ41_PLAL2|nr:Sua5/YciO/YrdC/YwlC family protein [Planctopirus limnophila]ADG68416.1 Protein-tyrosine phosphatase, low molecular weight [Planctopirus limnophila DSM 3776]